MSEINPKVVIVTVPFVDEDTPLAAPAVLKAALIANGIQCVALDLNIEIYNKLQHHPDRRLFLEFFNSQKINEKIVNDLVRMLDFYVQEILAHSPDIIGLSLFSESCQTFTAWLCAALRNQAPNIKIVIGGPGLATLENSLFKFPDRIKKLKLIDDYITGDAETSLVEYVKGNRSYPGINSITWEPNKNLNELPGPDYSDYRFFKYGYPLLPIVDSRGCVQNCEFCDVIAFWEKFQYRSAENIFQQMMKFIETYQVYRFQFASSICNGNLKEFKKLLELIVEYNDVVTLDEQIHWVGSFIVRPSTQHKKDLWELLKKSNGFLLTGVESISERVRINLGKKFTNADLDHHLIMAKEYQVPMNLLMIADYPTETEEDYENTIQWFIDHKEFANNTIMKVQCSLTTILPGTRLEKNVDFGQFCETKANRFERAQHLVEVLKQCKFHVQTFF